MPYYLLSSLTKMCKSIQIQTKNIESSLYHHGSIKMVVEHELLKQGVEWWWVLEANEFEETEEVTWNVVEDMSTNISKYKTKTMKFIKLQDTKPRKINNKEKGHNYDL